MYASLMPHLKQGTSEDSIWSFEWEKEAIDIQNKKTESEIQSEIDEMKAFWAKVDAVKKIV